MQLPASSNLAKRLTKRANKDNRRMTNGGRSSRGGETHSLPPQGDRPGTRLVRPGLADLRVPGDQLRDARPLRVHLRRADRKSTRLNSSHVEISYAVFCLKKKKKRHSGTILKKKKKKKKKKTKNKIT